MDPTDFIPIAAQMQGRWWAFPIPEGAFDQYVNDLADIDATKVAAAVDAIALEGASRPPTSGQIRRRIAEMELDLPTWEAARTTLRGWLAEVEHRLTVNWTCPYDRCDGDGFQTVVIHQVERHLHCPCFPQYLAARRGLDLLPDILAEFVGEGHTTRDELVRVIREGDTTGEAQLRTRWQQFTSRVVDSRLLAALAPGHVLPRLQAAREEDRDMRQRRGELTEADRPLALLEHGTAA